MTEPRLRSAVWLLAMLVLVAAAVRIPYLKQTPYDFTPGRQFYSALIARAAYFAMAGDPTGWRKQVVDDYMAYTTRPDAGIAEHIAAVAYVLSGGERPSLARAMSVGYWLIGAVALFLAARRLAGDSGGLVAASVFLFMPWGLAASRSLQPDPLAVALMCLSIWGAALYDEQPTRRRLFASAIAAGLAVLVRAPTACLLFPMLAVVLWRRHGLREWLTSRDVWIFWIIALAPAGLYYLMLTLTSPEFSTRAARRLAPTMWLEPTFWRGWLRQIDLAITRPVFVVTMAAMIVVPAAARTLVWPLWLGYVIYSLALPLPASTHTYYQTLAFPAVALTCGAAAGRLLGPMPLVLRMAAVVLITGALVMQAMSLGAFARRDDSAVVAAHRAVGEATVHSRRVIYLTDNFGVAIRFYGEVAGRAWPWRSEIAFYRRQGAAAIPELPATERLAVLSAELGGAEYFAVTELDELHGQPDLEQLLESRYPVIAAGERFIVYDLRPRR
jgi:hypothetical protein